ncbi:MAG TPA: hypothetical protein VJ945_01785 [Flavobacteriaceae bacterium]|nr:hypothetical protein [Flavobacteriaceae bacterium]
MRMLVNIILPIEPFNSKVNDGTAGETIGRIINEIKPESIYFTTQDGNRGATMVVDVKDPSQVPSIAEPWFLNFNAKCDFKIAMTPDDLQKANLSKLSQKWNNVPVHSPN